MKEKLKTFYMKVAGHAAELSYCERGKVGAVIVKNGNIISFGYNGTPSGFDNCCEEKKKISWSPSNTVNEEYELVTKNEVLHAEENAILKLAREGGSAEGSAMFCTRSVCQNCAKMVIAAGVKDFYYVEKYRTTEGLDMLERAGVNVSQVSLKKEEV